AGSCGGTGTGRPRVAPSGGAGSTPGSRAAPPRGPASRRRRARQPVSRRGRARRSAPRRAQRGARSQRPLEDLGSPLALGLGRNEREPPVAVAGRSEERTRRDDQAIVEESLRERLRALARGRLQPEVHGRLATRDANPGPRERRHENLSLARVDLAGGLDVLLVVPGDDGRALDELLRRGTDRWAVLLERADQLERGRDEAG